MTTGYAAMLCTYGHFTRPCEFNRHEHGKCGPTAIHYKPAETKPDLTKDILG